MGGGQSQVDMSRVQSFAVSLYEIALQSPCLLPDVSIDQSLVKYSGLNSSIELQQFSSQLAENSPGYVEKLGSALGSFTTIPNAVGLGALVISMIMEIIIKKVDASQRDDSYDMFRRVFGEEKASAVRDTMAEYLRRHQTYLNDNNQLKEELRRLEAELSKQLTQLKNSMLHDGQMSTRSFNIWVNGASFHVLMLIHKARLSNRRGITSSAPISTAIDLYLRDLDRLIEKYKSYQLEKISIYVYGSCSAGLCDLACISKNTENGCQNVYHGVYPFCSLVVREPYINHVFSTYGPILGLKTHFSNMKTNLNVLIKQHDSFNLPSAA